MKILNLYAGIGGNRMKWGGADITAVEYRQDIADVYSHYHPGDKIVVADAHDYLLHHYKDFDFIWSSPPCPTHSRMAVATRHPEKKYFDMKLWQEIIFLQHFFKGLWVVENVKPYYDPLVKPSVEINRHLFWSNFKILKDLKLKNVSNFIKSEKIEDFEKYLDIKVDWKIKTGARNRTAQTLRNCVHPDTGLHILNCAMGKFNSITTQKDLFTNVNP